MQFSSKNKWLLSVGTFPSGCPRGRGLLSQKSVLHFLIICKPVPRKGFQGTPDSLCIWDGEVDLLTRDMRRAAMAGWVRMPAVGSCVLSESSAVSFFFSFYFFPFIKFSLQGKVMVEAASWESSAGAKALYCHTHWLLGEAGPFVSVISSLVTFLLCRLELLVLK